MNYIDYIRHAVYTPGTYYRRYDYDLPQIQDSLKRIALTSLPFIGLYRPAGFTLSVGMNASRVFSHLQGAVAAEDRRDWKQCAIEIGQASLATLALATTLCHVTSALFLTTGCDTLQSLLNSGHALYKGEYGKALEEALQTLSSAAYLSFMMTGTLEVMVAFALLQAATSLSQARGEFAQGRYLEGCAKLGMAAIRLNQANQYMEQIQRRNAFLEIQRIRSLYLKVMRGRRAGHLLHHPLSSLKERIEANAVTLQDGQGNEVDFGSHFHGNGQTLVKGENLAFRTKIVDGKEVTELDFKINHAFRDRLNASIQQLKNIKPKEMQEILALTGSHATGVSFKSGSFFPSLDEHHFMKIGDAHQIEIEGLGTILIGASSDIPNLYDKVVVRLNADRTLFELHEILSFVDLEQAVALSTKEDIERLKMGHLFRTFFPKEATPFERTEEFFKIPLEELKQKMIEKSPDMKEIFETYFHRMKAEPLFDGRIRYRIEGLAEAAYEKGARGLMSAVMGAYEDDELYSRVASMIRMGMLATEVRHTYQMDQHGLGGGGVDYPSGGADSIYTQLITERDCKEKVSFNRSNYHSKIRFIISLDALETGTYQYYDDNVGNRVYTDYDDDWRWFNGTYAERDGILEFIEKEQQGPFRGGHEVMFKERIAPSFFNRLVVSNQQTKLGLIQYLEKCGLIQNNLILNRPVDQFIRVSNKMNADLF